MAKYNEELTGNQIVAMRKLEDALAHVMIESEKDRDFEDFIHDLQVFDIVDSIEESLGKVVDNLYEQKL